MWSIFFQAGSANKDNLLYELWERGTAGVIEEPTGLRAFFEDGIDIRGISALAPGAHIRRETNEPPSAESNLVDPILVGQRLFISPPGNASPLPPSRLRLAIPDGSAFGTGRHETTQLCLKALEQHFAPGSAVADIGCGSGILSLAARLLGAGRTISCDIHEDAISATRIQVETPVFMGSADALATACADITLANISASVLETLAFDLKRVTKPGGRLVISGFIRQRTPGHFQPEDVLEHGDWLCWICRPETVSASPPPLTGLSHKTDWWL